MEKQKRWRPYRIIQDYIRERKQETRRHGGEKAILVSVGYTERGSVSKTKINKYIHISFGIIKQKEKNKRQRNYICGWLGPERCKSVYPVHVNVCGVSERERGGAQSS